MTMLCLGLWRQLSLKHFFLTGQNIQKLTLGPICLLLPNAAASGTCSTLRISLMKLSHKYDHLIQYMKTPKLKEFKSFVYGEITRKWEFRFKLQNDRL